MSAVFKINDVISIHAPTRGATLGKSTSDLSAYISIHAPTRGATCTWLTNAINAIFQSTLLQEERQIKSFY